MALNQIKILVVEDNPVNQKVAARILSSFGCLVELAENGERAISKVLSNEYDIIFMDCQMPEMDGFEATRKIRGLEQEKSARTGNPDSRVPIIAMTANAMTGDREKCIAAGMDDYISKPVSLDILKEKLIKWIQQQPIAKAIKSTRKGDLIMSDAAKIDMQTIRQLKDLADDDDPNFFTDIVKGYIETTEANINELLDAVHANDVVKVTSTAHCMKGASGNIGALRMQEISFELEKNGKNEDLTGAEELLTELKQEFCKVTIVLENEL